VFYMKKILIGGNWKMNGLQKDFAEVQKMETKLGISNDVVLCLPATLLYPYAQQTQLALGGQDCHVKLNGAYTGDISAEQLKNIGASYVIIGHSERRHYHFETDEIVNTKAMTAWNASLKTILCIGETKEQREAGKTLDILANQLQKSVPNSSTSDKLIIAYEPVWAIGTGLTPSIDDIKQAHNFMRATLINRFGADAKNIILQYGGSVKASNANEIAAIENVNGALVGGASLKADDFIPIVEAFRKV
jgi:triosephosphate isomerase